MNNVNNILKEQYKKPNNLLDRLNLHTKYSTNNYSWSKWILDQIDIPKRATILELGSGTGIFWEDIIKKIPNEWEITLSDFSSGMINESKKRLKKYKRKFNYKIIDAEEITFRSNQFDCVIANHMLYHVNDIRKTLIEIKRVLKDNGKLYSATNGIKHMYELRQIIKSVVPNYKSLDENFTLENGIEVSKKVFKNVIIKKYDNNLIINNVNDLLKYLYSMNSLKIINTDQFKIIEQKIISEFNKNNIFNIQKDVGLIISN